VVLLDLPPLFLVSPVCSDVFRNGFNCVARAVQTRHRFAICVAFCRLGMTDEKRNPACHSRNRRPKPPELAPVSSGLLSNFGACRGSAGRRTGST